MPAWANELTLGQVILFLTTVAGFLSVAWKERRNRLWAIEDKRLAAEERERERNDLIAKAKVEADALIIRTEAIARAVSIEAQAVAERLRIEAEAIAQNVAKTLIVDNKATTNRLAASIAEVGASAHRAYEEANHVNVKIEQLNARLLAQEETQGEQKLDHVIATGDSIEEKVDRLNEKIS
jgi:hypothetical protein